MKLDKIQITVERTGRRKTVSIFIERNGTVRALAPMEASDTKIETAIRSKEFLIFKKLAKWRELNKEKVTREFVNGQSFMYLGRNYRLKIVENQDVPLKISGGFMLLRKSHLKNARTAFKEYYREKALLKISERLKLLEEKFQKRPASIKVLELGNRWASWTPKNVLNFHWKCIMAPVSVLDYIISHEMVHLVHPNHSPEFWNELDKKMPEYIEHANWLKKNGVKMTL